MFVLIIIYSIASCLILIFIDSWFIRILTLPLFFFILGYPLSFFVSNLDAWERFFLAFGLSSLLVLLTYYLQYISCFYFGCTPTFTQYIIEISIVLWISIGILYIRRPEIIRKKQLEISKSWRFLKDLIINNKYLLCIIVIGVILRFVFLNRPDLGSDETYFMGLSYPMIDTDHLTGLPSPPFQYLSAHHPHTFHVQGCIVMNIFNPFGWGFMDDWMVKFLPAFLGTLTIIVYYVVVTKIYDKTAGLISGAFVATCTYAVIISRLCYHEVLVILIMGIVIYFAYKERWGLTGFFIGLSLLVKFTALVIIPPILFYLIIRYLRIDKEKFKVFLKNLSSLVFVVVVLFLPIFIANVASYYQFGYADSFWSRLFGLADPLTEAVGEAEMPVSLNPSMFAFLPLQVMQLINVLGILSFIFILICIIFSFSDKGNHLTLNIILLIFLVEYLLIFTSRWFQIISLAPLFIVPFTILSSRIVKLISIRKKMRLGKRKREILTYGIICLVIGFSIIYSWNTVAIDHSTKDFSDDYYEAMHPAYYFSNLGYLWISSQGYDDVINIIRNYSAYTVYIDNDHPMLSYTYYFWVRNYTLFISDWNYTNNSLFVIYKFPNNFWESFTYSTADDLRQAYIESNCTLIFENQNFKIFLSN